MGPRGPLTPTGALRAPWAVLMILVTGVMIAVGGIMYTTHNQRVADRRWCELLRALSNPTPQPDTPRGRDLLSEYRRLHREFGCGDR